MSESGKREVTDAEAVEIITKREPRGLFYQKDGDITVGIDNSTGEAWTEDFNSLDECLAWLEGADGVTAGNEPQRTETQKASKHISKNKRAQSAI